MHIVFVKPYEMEAAQPHIAGLSALVNKYFCGVMAPDRVTLNEIEHEGGKALALTDPHGDIADRESASGVCRALLRGLGCSL